MSQFIAPIEAIQLPTVSGTAGVSGFNQPTAVSGFADIFTAQFEGVNADMTKAEGALQALATGQPVELHDVMIALEQARIGVQTVIQIRNRMIEAYQDLARMQI